MSTTRSPTETSVLAGVRAVTEPSKSPGLDRANLTPTAVLEHEVITGFRQSQAPRIDGASAACPGSNQEAPAV